MSTRGMVALRTTSTGPYELFYEHMDTYPTWLGARLLPALKKCLEAEHDAEFEDEVRRVIQDHTQEPLNRAQTVSKPEDAFLKVQGDLEWIYAIDLRFGSDYKQFSRIAIYRTSNPWDYSINTEPFAWCVYDRCFCEIVGGCLESEFEESEKEMRRVEDIATATKNVVKAFVHANDPKKTEY
jgi:hypothetical protein